MQSRIKQLLAMLFALALLAGACGSDSDAGDTTETTADAGEETTDADADATDDDAMDDDAMEDDSATEDDAMEDEEAAAGSCAVADLPLKTPDTLTIATGEPVFEPWMTDDDPTNGEGFESAVAYALAEQMGFTPDQVTWVRTDFDAAIAPGEKDYDFNMQQYSITEERDEIVDFSVPYYVGQKSVMALEGSPADGATTLADLEEATFGATIGTTDLDYIVEVLGIDDAPVYDTQADLLAALDAGQIDAIVVNLPSALYLTAVEFEGAVIAGVLPNSEGGEDGMGLLFEDGSELVSCVDEALLALDDAGTLDDLAVQYLQGDDVPTITE